jgi:hypothetical protein
MPRGIRSPVTPGRQDLSTINPQQRQDQIIKKEMALRNILGFFPTYMRPPYSDCTVASGCEATLNTLGYHIVYFDVDTDDYDNGSPLLIQNSKNNFKNALAGHPAASNDFLVIAHDIDEQTAHNLTTYMLQTLLAQGFTPGTLGQCLGDPAANWDRSASGAATVSPVSATTSASTSRTTSTTTPASGTTTITTTAAKAASIDGACGIAALYCELVRELLQPVRMVW